MQYFNYFAKHGYVVAKVDIRGTGSSSGRLPTEEYSDIELCDGRNVINYLAYNLSSISNGNVGMFGISWGAFNGLMLAFDVPSSSCSSSASSSPSPLKAVVAVDGSEDLYANDIHYIDGVMHMDEYIASMCHENALPQSINEYNGTSLARFSDPNDDYYADRFR